MKHRFTSWLEESLTFLPWSSWLRRRRRSKEMGRIIMVRMCAPAYVRGTHGRPQLRNTRARLDQPVKTIDSTMTRSSSHAAAAVTLRIICNHNLNGIQFQKALGTI